METYSEMVQWREVCYSFGDLWMSLTSTLGYVQCCQPLKHGVHDPAADLCNRTNESSIRLGTEPVDAIERERCTYNIKLLTLKNLDSYYSM